MIGEADCLFKCMWQGQAGGKKGGREERGGEGNPNLSPELS